MNVIRLESPVVVGSGAAGLSVALGLGQAVVMSAREMGSTWWAQGGIAAAWGRDDSPEQHAADTIAAGHGIADEDAVAVLTYEAGTVIERLIGLGMQFDTDLDGELLLGSENGHRRQRVVRADGDATGAELMRSLIAAIERSNDIQRVVGRVVDLVRCGDRVSGVVTADGKDRRVYLSPAVVLATGGAGRLFARTTNPPGIAGDGIAMAARAGALLTDLEFVRFHATALLAGKDPLPLLPDALRDEGADLVDPSGRTLTGEHLTRSDLDSGPALARALHAQRERDIPVYLDARSLVGFWERFPAATAHAMSVGLDPSEHLLPVTPAAHFSVGGIKTDTYGRTSVPGLWAVGECASTGVDGAVGLESNSLLEGLVFGARAAESVRAESQSSRGEIYLPAGALDLPVVAGPAMDDLRDIMWNHVGPIRDGDGLAQARAGISSMASILSRTIEGRNALSLALMMIDAATWRTESRGSHYRSDHPSEDPEQARRTITEPAQVEWAELGPPTSEAPNSPGEDRSVASVDHE